MDVLLGILPWVKANWVQITASVVLVDKLLGLIAPLTPWKFDDRAERVLADLITRFFTKKTPA